MNVGDLRRLIADVADDVEVVRAERHPSIPPEYLADGEYDDYGGLTTGNFVPMSASDFKVGDQLVIDSD